MEHVKYIKGTQAYTIESCKQSKSSNLYRKN